MRTLCISMLTVETCPKLHQSRRLRTARVRHEGEVPGLPHGDRCQDAVRAFLFSGKGERIAGWACSQLVQVHVHYTDPTCKDRNVKAEQGKRRGNARTYKLWTMAAYPKPRIGTFSISSDSAWGRRFCTRSCTEIHSTLDFPRCLFGLL